MPPPRMSQPSSHITHPISYPTTSVAAISGLDHPVSNFNASLTVPMDCGSSSPGLQPETQPLPPSHPQPQPGVRLSTPGSGGDVTMLQAGLVVPTPLASQSCRFPCLRRRWPRGAWACSRLTGWE
ncbi:unnamed protein product [Discosporangium mesarthrocarpum]